MPNTVPSGSLALQAAEEIRSRIVDGRLELGQALSETALAAQLGMSKTPIREALLCLKTEGLVEVLPQRGTFVFDIGLAHARALTEFRAILETAALECAMRRNAEGLAADLGTIVARMRFACTPEEWSAYRIEDDLFHRCIVTGCSNQFMVDAYERIALQVQTLRTRVCINETVNFTSLNHHRTLVELVSRGEVHNATALLRMHIITTLSEYEAWLAASPPNKRQAGAQSG